jgi:tetratricopeptide (TPR) repeat protein
MENSNWLQGQAFAKEGKFELALESYDKALLEEHENPDLLNDRGVCMLHLGRTLEAEVDMTRAIELQPDYGYRYAARAYVRAALKNLQGAIADYQYAIELDPEDAISMNNLGMIEEQMGYVKEANDRYKVADELMGILKDTGINLPEEPAAPIQKSEPIDIPQHASSVDESPSYSSVFKSVFTSKKVFTEFVSFIRNGFKLGDK